MSATASNSDLFARSHRLDGGVRVRLRLAHSGDERALRDLIERLGYEPSSSVLQELVRFDPQRRAITCASALVGGRERILGFGWIDLESPRRASTVVVEPDYAVEVGRLLRQAMASRAAAHDRGE
jgi:hypothetical protein